MGNTILPLPFENVCRESVITDWHFDNAQFMKGWEMYIASVNAGLSRYIFALWFTLSYSYQ